MQFDKLEDLILKLRQKHEEEEGVREKYSKNLKNVTNERLIRKASVIKNVKTDNSNKTNPIFARR